MRSSTCGTGSTGWAVAVSLAALLVLGGCALVEDASPPAAASERDVRSHTSSPSPAARADGGSADRADRDGRGRRRTTPPPRTRATEPYPEPSPGPPPTPGGGRLVARVIDGDTVELRNGDGVRLVGVDTPERGECGFDRATDALARLVEGERVRLTRPGEDRDRYGRLLRYLDVGDVDPGLRLIRRGLAVARYDSRDGYGFHPRQPSYVAADRVRGPAGCTTAAPSPRAAAAPPPAASGSCASGYSPCIPSYPPDLDCGDLTGPVRVRGSDPHGLDGDGDGRACES